MAPIETGQAAFRRQVQPVLRYGVPCAAERGGIVDRLRKFIVGAYRETTPETLRRTQCQGMQDGIADGGIVGEAGRVAQLVPFSEAQRAGRSLIRKRQNIQPGAFRPEVSSLDEESATELALDSQIPGLRVWSAIVAVNGERIRDLSRHRGDKSSGEIK